jgi:hypothetical protein
MATIDMIYNHKTDDGFLNIDVADYLRYENVQSRWISILQVELAENWANICPKELQLVIVQKLSTAIMDSK